MDTVIHTLHFRKPHHDQAEYVGHMPYEADKAMFAREGGTGSMLVHAKNTRIELRTKLMSRRQKVSIA